MLHCPTQRAPIPRATCRSSSRSTTSPSCATRRCSTSGRAATARSRFRRIVRAARRIIVGSEFTRREVAELLDVPGREAARDPVRRGRLVHGSRRGRTRAATTCSRSPRSSRARTSTRLSRAFDRADLDGLELRVVGAEGLGRRAASAATTCAGSERSATPSWRASTAARRPSPTCRSTRASGSRCWRRWPAAPRWSLPPARRSASSRTASPSRSIPRDTDSIALGLREAVERRDELGPLGRERATEFTWATRGEGARRRVPRGGRVSADRDRRRRPRPAAHRRRDLRRLAAARARAAASTGGDLRRHAAPRPRARRSRGRRAAGPQPDRPDDAQPAAAPAAAAPRPRALPLRHPAGLPRPFGRHRSRPVVRAPARRHGLPRPAPLPHPGAALGAPRRSRADRLGVDEARPDRALRRRGRAHRRHALRRRSRLPPRRPASATATTRSSSARSSRARTR